MDEIRTARSKIRSRADAAAFVDEAKAADRTVVFTNGCFDILHIGHVRYLQAARALGDVLVVGVNIDESVRALKGPGRPLNPETERAEVLAALECVDCVTLFNEATPIELILAIKPDIHSKGGDYAPDDLPEAEAVRGVGGKVVVIAYSTTDTQGKSTTELIGRMAAHREE